MAVLLSTKEVIGIFKLFKATNRPTENPIKKPIPFFGLNTRGEYGIVSSGESSLDFER